MKFKSDYPDCLFNSWKDLDLGSVQLRYLDLGAPSLITIFELERPAILARKQLNKILESLKNVKDEDFAVKGLFALGFAQFETMLNNLLIKIFQFFPQKLSALKHDKPDDRAPLIGVGQEQLLNGEVIRQIIESHVNRLAYSSLGNFLKSFTEVFSIKEKFLNFPMSLISL